MPLRETRLAILITLGYMSLLSVVFSLFGDALIGVFNTDAEVVRIGVRVMLCAAVFQLFDGIGIVYVSALRGDASVDTTSATDSIGGVASSA